MFRSNLIYNLITKCSENILYFPYKPIKQITIMFRNMPDEHYLPSIIALFFLTNKKAKIHTKQVSIRNSKKLQINYISVTLKNSKDIYNFCKNLSLLYLPKKEYFKGLFFHNLIDSQNCIIKIPDIFIFSELEEEMNKFFKVKNLEIKIEFFLPNITSTTQALNLMQLPISNDSTRKLS